MQDWQAELAVGACRAGRLLALAGLGLALLALAVLACRATASVWQTVVWSGVVLAAVPGLYLGARIEMDRGLFQRLSRMSSGAVEALPALDAALAELNPSTRPGRDLGERVGGLFRLVRRLGGLVMLQMGLALLAAWLG